jgi:hypothetical protein
MKNVLDGLQETAEERISEFDDWSIETFQTEIKEKNGNKSRMNRM